MPSVCLYCEIPEKFHDLFPEDRGGNDNSPPHITVLYIGDVPEENIDSIVKICADVAQKFTPIECEFGEVDTFPNGVYGVPHIVHIIASKELESLHHLLWGLIQKSGLDVEHRFTYNPHTTLKYLPEGKKYNGKIPKGKFTVDSLIVSVFKEKDER